MTRERLAQLVLAAAAVGGLLWVYPRLSRSLVRFEVPSAPCAERVSIEVLQDGVRVRSLRVVPARRPPAAHYEAHLHRGEYRVHVRLDCADGEIRDGEPRPIVVEDEATYHLRSPPACDCPP